MVSHQQVAAAKVMLSAGRSLVDCAVALGVRSSHLDQALWSQIGVSVEQLFAGMGRPMPKLHTPDF